MKKLSTIALWVFVAAFGLSFIRWLACDVERSVTIEKPAERLGNESTSDTLAPILLKRSIEAERAADADAGVVVHPAIIVEPLTEAELENARGDLEALERNFDYNPFAGFEIPAEQYARFARVNETWHAERERVFAAELNGDLATDEIDAALDKADRDAYAAYQAILGADKVEMLVSDMREWGEIEVIPKLSELTEQGVPSDQPPVP